MTGPASTLAHQFAQVRNGLKHRQRGTGSTRNTEPALAALSVIERHLEDMEAVVDAAREVSRIEATGVLPDFMPLAHALAALSVGEERSETRG